MVAVVCAAGTMCRRPPMPRPATSTLSRWSGDAFASGEREAQRVEAVSSSFSMRATSPDQRNATCLFNGLLSGPYTASATAARSLQCFRELERRAEAECFGGFESNVDIETDRFAHCLNFGDRSANAFRLGPLQR